MNSGLDHISVHFTVLQTSTPDVKLPRLAHSVTDLVYCTVLQVCTLCLFCIGSISVPHKEVLPGLLSNNSGVRQVQHLASSVCDNSVSDNSSV
jgi:hypothetical protein